MPEALRICPQCGLETTGAVCARDGFATVVRGRIGGQAPGREGQTIATRYRVDQTLETGPVGVIYRGYDLVRMKPVTVRVFAAHYSADLALIARFQREGQLLPGLVHPNVLQTIEHGIAEDGALFQALEGTHGPTLTEVLKRDGPFEPDRAMMLGIQIISALATAHAQGILHRSLSLDAVLLTSTAAAGTGDIIKVRDFGLVQILADENAQSFQYPGELTTAWRTMAPEQARGKGISGHADVYAMGAVLYELLTGRPVFNEQSAADLMVAHMVKMPPPIVSIERAGSPVPGPLAELIHRCLDKKPWNRPDGATKLLGMVDGIARQLGIQAQPIVVDAPAPLPAAVAAALARAPRTSERARPATTPRAAAIAVPAMAPPTPAEPTPPTSGPQEPPYPPPRPPPPPPFTAPATPATTAPSMPQVRTAPSLPAAQTAPALPAFKTAPALPAVPVMNVQPFAATEALARPIDLSGNPSTRPRQRPNTASAVAVPPAPPPAQALEEKLRRDTSAVSTITATPRSGRRSMLLGVGVGIGIAGIAAVLAVVALSGGGSEKNDGHGGAQPAPLERAANVNPNSDLHAAVTVPAADAGVALAAEVVPEGTVATAVALAGADVEGDANAAEIAVAAADVGPEVATGDAVNGATSVAANNVAEVWDGAATKVGTNKVATNATNATNPGAKVDPKLDPTRSDIPPRLDPPRVDPPKVDPNKVDPNKKDPNKKDPFADVEDPDVVGKTPPAGSSKRRVLVVSEPAGATLTVRGMQVGVTPMWVEWDDVGQQVDLAIVKTGFKPYRARIGPSTGATLRVQLWAE